ncbi:MAG: DEAD/DEAH box helicase family protein [bacterium]|jgi:type III restriction enzyme
MAVIENPILNSPYEEPKRHFKHENGQPTGEIVEERRISQYSVPVAKPRASGRRAQLELDIFDSQVFKPNELINNIRHSVGVWRSRNYPNISSPTRRLIQYWRREERERRLFFCQLEAIETAIYITECAEKSGDSRIINELVNSNRASNPELFRIAFKMATGSGKTLVMAMLITWQVLNKRANPQDARFSDTFLIITPGITIKDRLRVLYPSDPENYYEKWDLIPHSDFDDIQSANILVTNFHSFLPRETISTPKLTKEIIWKGSDRRTKETPGKVVARVCAEFLKKKNIVVINDEGHHCYRRKAEEPEEEELKGEEKQEAKKRDEYARIWISGLEAVQKKLGIRVVYDLSATPFFLRGSGWKEGTLFPWVVSDFSLVDAIECGVVKVPRVPVSDDQMTDEVPKYRHIWPHVKDDLPKKGRGAEAETGEPKLPVTLAGAIHSLYSNYEKYFEAWKKESESRHINSTPPVFIVVCNNTNVSKLVYDYISGWEKRVSDSASRLVPGELPLFSNVETDYAGNMKWRARPYTILVDSEQLESGEALSADFRKIAANEIESFKNEYRNRYIGKDIEKITDSDILREVMNTVGKPGKLGENVRCVVSVSMLTEGWDANTVTHILGIRAFGTQLLCEQVVGRALRRMSFELNDENKFSPEYAEVYGVPFTFMQTSGGTAIPVSRPYTRVQALPERAHCEIRFPRVAGYRYELTAQNLSAEFTDDSRLTLSAEDIPTTVENAPIVGESSIHELNDLRARREQEVAFLIAKLTLERYFTQEIERPADNPKVHKFNSEVKYWYFPQVLEITRRWIKDCVKLKDKTFIQELLLLEFAYRASDKIYRAIVHGDRGEKRLMPILHPYNTEGSTSRVDFETTKPVYSTSEDKCHVSHVVGDTQSWEQKMAKVFEDPDMPEVLHYVKNANLGFTIPYTLYGEEKQYYPDFIAHIDDGREDPLNLIVEVTGIKKKDKEAKVETGKTLWVPAVNNHGGFGRWAFLEVRDPWNCMDDLKAFIEGNKEDRPNAAQN